MSNTQAIKRRITSVKNTKQITKAMELVAASKLRKAQELSLKSRMYRNSAREILARLSELHKAQEFELYKARPVQTRLYVLFTSDRGLAGAYNSNIIKLALKEFNRDQEAGVKSQVITIGKKGSRAVAKLDNVELVGVYHEWPTYPSPADVESLYQDALQRFRSQGADEVHVLYTDFKSSIEQIATDYQLLPSSLNDEIKEVIVGRDINDSIFEPSAEAVLEQIVPKLIKIQFLQAALEASASEQSMRMMAMKNASDNANDLIDDLTLEFNSARQAAITQELAEITGGAAAIQ